MWSWVPLVYTIGINIIAELKSVMVSLMPTGTIAVTLQENRYRVLSATEFLDTWQLSTALVFIQLAISHLRSNKEEPGC
jgi:hypothetical protein